MTAQIEQHAAAARVVVLLPADRPVGIDRAGVQVFGRERRDAPQLTRCNQLVRQHGGREEAVIERKLCLDPGGAGGVRDAARAFVIDGQRLVDIDVLAGGDCVQRHLLVEVIGGADGHHVDFGIGEELMVIVGSVFEALFARSLLGLFEAARAYTDEARLEIEIIMQGHGLY